MSAPWTTPELTSQGRLPMHSVPHLDRLELHRAEDDARNGSDR